MSKKGHQKFSWINRLLKRHVWGWPQASKNLCTPLWPTITCGSICVDMSRMCCLVIKCDPPRRNQSHVSKQKNSVFDRMLYSSILAFQNCFCFSYILFLKEVMSL